MVKIPEKIQLVLDTLTQNGYEAYIVGGCVRDSLLGFAPNDFDVTTSAKPQAVIDIFENTIPTGLKHGTVTVLCDRTPVEVTTFRTEGEYFDSRHPENVEFVSDLETDLSRRDFTVNALAFSKKSGVVDYFGGISDLENKILRAVGNPERRFSEDALRILRLFRFSSQLGFEIEQNTLNSALLLQRGLESISKERIFTELLKGISGKDPFAMSHLIKSGGLNFLGICKTPDFNVIKALKSENLKLFAFLKDACETPVSVLRKLKASNAQISFTENLLKLSEMNIKSKCDIKRAMLLTDRQIVTSYFEFLSAKGENTKALQAFSEEIIQNGEPYLISHLAVTGDDLIKQGFKAKEIGERLKYLLETVIDNPEKNKKEILLKI